jgi:branched-chain amino acid aminotransferase
MARLLSPVWFNDSLVDGKLVPIDASDRGLTLGDGLFETLPVFGGRPVFLRAHLARLMKGAAALGISLEPSEIEAGLMALLKHHGAIQGILRITVTRGAGMRGLSGETGENTLLMTLAPWTKGMLGSPVRLMTAGARRNEHSPASRLKTLSYIDNILAAREAAAAGADDALMLNSAGRVACSAISNIILVSGTSLKTPALSEGVLAGIIRGMIGAEEIRVEPSALFECDAVFLTNSLRLVRRGISLDGRKLPQTAMQRVEEILEDLCAKIAEDCGTDPRTVDAS